MTGFILDLIQSWGYFGIFVLMMLENVFPPIPSEVIMALGGIAAAQGRFDFWTLIAVAVAGTTAGNRSEEHTSELQSLMRISYAVFCLKKKTTNQHHNQ